MDDENTSSVPVSRQVSYYLISFIFVFCVIVLAATFILMVNLLISFNFFFVRILIYDDTFFFQKSSSDSLVGLLGQVGQSLKVRIKVDYPHTFYSGTTPHDFELLPFNTYDDEK